MDDRRFSRIAWATRSSSRSDMRREAVYRPWQMRAAPRTPPESETSSLPARSRTRDAGGAFHGDPDGAEKFMARLLAGPARARMCRR